MSVEDIVEEYSRKWKVSREEAEMKIKKMLEEKTPSQEKFSKNYWQFNGATSNINPSP